MNLLQLTNEVNSIYYNDTSSYKMIASKQKELLAIMGASTDITTINNKTILKYLNKLRDNNNSTATINSKLVYLSKCLNYAYQNNLIKNKPHIPIFKIQATKEKYLTENEIKQMLEYSLNFDYELYKIILIGINTGMRISNILALTANDIEDGYIRVYQNKTNKPYSIPINKHLKELLTGYKPIELNYRQAEYRFKKMINKLNLDTTITIHTLRHTFCSLLIQNNIEPAIIQKLANHKSILTTMRYIHLNNKQLEQAVAVL